MVQYHVIKKKKKKKGKLTGLTLHSYIVHSANKLFTRAVFTTKQVHTRTCFARAKFRLISLIYPSTARVVGAPQMISQPVSSIFPCSPLLSGTWQTPGLSIPWCRFLFPCLPCLLPPFTVPCKMVLARPDERETWPYHGSLHLFAVVRKSSCGPIACWILARTSLLVSRSFTREQVHMAHAGLRWLTGLKAPTN